MKKADGKINTHLILSLFAVFLVIIAMFCMFPITGDDWFREDVGRSIKSISDLVSTVFDKYMTTNGRILGNVLAYSAGSRPVLRIIMASVITLLLSAAVWKNTSFSSPCGYIIAFLCAFFLPREMFRQIYPWMAGFFNYVPPVVIFLFAVYIMRNIFSDEPLSDGTDAEISVFILGLCGQLFMENNTLCCLAAGFILIILHAVLHKKISKTTVFYTIGTILGAAILFLSPSYRAVSAEGSAYSSGLGGGIAGLIMSAKNNHFEVFWDFVGGNTLLVAVITLLVMWNFFAKKERVSLDFAAFILTVLGTAYIVLYRGFNLFLGNGYLFSASCILWILGVFLSCLAFPEDKYAKLFGAFWIVCACIAAGPLLFVSPIGPRCLFASYVFTVLAGSTLIAPEKINENVKKTLNICTAVLLIVVSLYYASKYLPISKSAAARYAAIEAAMKNGESSVTVTPYPNGNWLWEPETDKMESFYYYSTPGDFDIRF